MSRWIVNWETWNFNEQGKIYAIVWLAEFEVEATSLEEAIQAAEKAALEKLVEMQKRVPEEFAAAANSVPQILGLRDECGHYYELRKAREVLFGQIRERDDYGSSIFD